MDASTDTRALFDRWARSGRGVSMARAHAPTVARALDRIDLPPDGWFLDIGCGVGDAVRRILDRIPRGRAYGLDLSEAMIEEARRLGRESPGGDRVEWVRSVFPDEDLLPAGRFDAIFSMETFYYLPDLEAGLRRVRELLKRGGRFLCVVDYYAENTASHSWRKEMGVPMRLLSERGWRARFAEAGLRVVEQGRIRLDPTEASAEWKAKRGSLYTLGERAED